MMAINHWKEHLPKKYQQLKQAGTLEQEAIKVQEQAKAQVTALFHQGMTIHEAEEQALKELIVLPEESETTE
jgi:hypothetical protein